tara:strand:- start:332 stop:718 length:387 start_codon:yes stop_codon:yes gene_type:complete
MNNNVLMKDKTKKQLIQIINHKDNEILKLNIFEKELDTKESYSVEDYDKLEMEKNLEYMKLQKDFDNLATQLYQSQKQLKSKLNENNIITKKIEDIVKPICNSDSNKLMKQTKKELIQEIDTLRKMIN